MQSNRSGGLLQFTFAAVIVFNVLKTHVGKYDSLSEFINKLSKSIKALFTLINLERTETVFKCRRTPELKLYTFILCKMQPAISSNVIVFGVMHTTQRLFVGFYLKISSFKFVLQEETQHSWEFPVTQL